MARLLLLFLVALPVAASAQVYRWKDASGRVHYSQVPPPGADARQLAPPPPVSAAPNQDALNKSLQDAAKAEPKAREAAAKAAEEQASRQRECQSLREQIAFMDQSTARRMTTTDAQGNVSRVTTEQFDARRDELVGRASAVCS